MSAETIPEDIRDVAEGVVSRISYVMPDPASVREDIEQAINDAVMAEREKHAWQPIATAPTDGTVMLFEPGYPEPHLCVFEGFFLEGSGWICAPDRSVCVPTMWMPKPAAPKAEG